MSLLAPGDFGAEPVKVDDPFAMLPSDVLAIVFDLAVRSCMERVIRIDSQPSFYTTKLAPALKRKRELVRGGTLLGTCAMMSTLRLVSKGFASDAQLQRIVPRLGLSCPNSKFPHRHACAAQCVECGHRFAEAPHPCLRRKETQFGHTSEHAIVLSTSTIALAITVIVPASPEAGSFLKSMEGDPEFAGAKLRLRLMYESAGDDGSPVVRDITD